MQRYDKTLKEILKTIPHKLLKLLTGFEDGIFLDVQFSEIKSREPDLLVELPNGSIFHLELQSGNEEMMIWRMHEYYSLIHRQYRREPEQVVLYVGDEPLHMENEIVLKNLTYRCRIMDMREINCSELL